MKIDLIPMGGMGVNCYVVSDGETAAVVDPGEENFALRSFAESTNLGIKYILLTHGHFDHIGGVAYLKKMFPQALVCIGEGDAAMLESSEANLGARFGIRVEPCPADRLLRDGDILTLGNEKIKVMQTPGHSPGCVVYLVSNCALCGDTLFRLSIGRCDFPGSDVGQMRESLEKLALLPPETLLYPGHGDATSLDYELKYNPYLR